MRGLSCWAWDQLRLWEEKPVIIVHQAQRRQWLSVDLQREGGEGRTEPGARISAANDSRQCLVRFGAFPERCLRCNSVQLLKPEAG